MKKFLVALFGFSTFYVACKTTTVPTSSLEGKKIDDALLIPQFVRFNEPLKAIEASLAGASNIDDAAKKFVSGPARVAAYQLQALGKLYEDESKWFKDLKDEFRTIEDTIGEYDKWNNILTKASSSLTSEKKVELEGFRQDGLKAVKKLLKDQDWFGTPKTRAEKLRNQLAKFDWKKPSKDRTMVLGYIANEAAKMRDTKYNLENLEKGKGLHELRRDMKWLLIEMRVLNGLVLKNTSACPFSEYAALVKTPIANSKYSELPFSNQERNPCLIPECLFLGLVQAVEDIGRLKDDAEFRLNTTEKDKDRDKMPADLKATADQFYKGIQDGQLFDRTSEAINSCQR
ncbi:MAG: hypothetical protein NT027_19485 [Proteobacteria bacterium]|nr:hypothetical protein [Pseudomonadota bacterium]